MKKTSNKIVTEVTPIRRLKERGAVRESLLIKANSFLKKIMLICLK